MEHLCTFTFIIARVCVAVIFVLNGAGIISQTLPARELAERHVPDRLIPLFMFAARTVEIVAGLALAGGLFPRYAAIALFAFIVPATFVSHTFWSAKDGEEFQRQLRNFSMNVAIWGALLFIAATPAQPSFFKSPW
jgi:putative oxidoreductase